MFRLAQPKENAVLATYQYLKAIGAKVSEETVEETLKNHPDYPSLLATSDALNEWNVENVAVKITPEQLLEIPTPFLAYLNSNGGIFALIKSIKNNKIEWIHTIKGTQRESIEDFNKNWNGVVLIAEANENSIEKNYAENHQKEIIKNLRTPIIDRWCNTSYQSIIQKLYIRLAIQCFIANKAFRNYYQLPFALAKY
jgi:ABC-type bacteriocin/lantibiotic exporter with double-glycine peptidase domain